MGRKPKDKEDQIFNTVEQARISADLTRQELADLVGVHYQTIGYIERDEYSPSLVLALKIARALNQPIEKLFSLEGKN
jgi:DNA-binding XRE family transcriptional regulator